MINYKTLRIPNNYVLVLPDPDHDSYTFNGIETGILVGTTAERHKDDDIEKEMIETCQATGQHKSVKGIVYKVPDNLIYNGEDFVACRGKFDNSRSSMVQLKTLKESSMLYDVPMEVSEGDEVVFHYAQHYECYQTGRYIETELGDMLFIRYDCLMFSYPKGEPEKIKPLNGRVIIENKPLPKKESSILIATVSQRVGRVPKVAYAEIIQSGALCKGYFEDLTVSDDRRDLNQGDYIAYKSSQAHLLEWGLHQTLFGGKEVYAIHRKDLLAVLPKYTDYVCGIDPYDQGKSLDTNPSLASFVVKRKPDSQIDGDKQGLCPN